MPYSRPSRTKWARQSQLVATMPPSPATTSLVGDMLKTWAVPPFPTGRPCMLAPKPWAASITSGSPCSAATASSAGISQGLPKLWQAAMATVRGVIAAAIAWGVTLVVRGSTSTKTGRRLFQTMAAVAARKVKLGRITSPSGSVRLPVRATPNRESASIVATGQASVAARRLRQLPAERSRAR